MGAASKIEWTDASWNPIRARRSLPGSGHKISVTGWHCEHVSEGCRRCYAESLNKRLGTGLEFKPGNREKVELFLDEKMLLAPLSWREPRMIFVCSMTDLFADFVPDEWIGRMFAVMALCPRHTFQVLTKRPERMLKYLTTWDDDKLGLPEGKGDRRLHICIECFRINDELSCNAATNKFSDNECLISKWPLANVWLGTSCEDQAAFDERWAYLRKVPSAVTFLSLEPVLGEIFFRPAKPDWIICGGESGHGARWTDIAWVRDILAQCLEADIPCFVKQLGARPFNLWPKYGMPFATTLKSRRGSDMAEWPPDLRVREWPK